MDTDDGQNQKQGDAVARNDLNPDQAVSLRQSVPDAVAAVSPAESSTAVVPPLPAAPTTPPSSPADPPVAPSRDLPVEAPATQSDVSATEPAAGGPVEISWTASEFIAHPKSMQWYLVLAGITVVIVVLAYLINHDIITALAILIAAGLFGYMAGRQPRQLQYSLGASTINIGARAYPYKDFNAYSIVEEGPFSSIDFMPLKRFAPILSVYYDPAQEPAIMQALSGHLPFANHKRTAVDNLMHRIRF